MESIIASDVKSFLFSNCLISDLQFGFHPILSMMDILLLFSQQWLEAMNLKQEVRTVSLDIYRACFACELSAYGREGFLHIWISDFLHSHSKYVAIIKTLSSNGSWSSPWQCFGLSLVPHLY